MTKREAAIVSAYTGFLCGKFEDLHEYAEELFDGPVYSHTFGDKKFAEALKVKSKHDFINIKIEKEI
jgi:hypothetical protein